MVALVAAALDKSESHSNTALLQIKATKVEPKLSKDHNPGGKAVYLAFNRVSLAVN
jgi:hypothetical protein